MDKDGLKDVLEKHRKWLNGEAGGERADLSEANLSKAYLSGANLCGVDLSKAYLSGANLYGADLSHTCVFGFYLGKHFAFYHEGYLKIGCEGNNLKWWKENYKDIGQKNNYAESEIKRYGDMIDLLIKWEKEKE